MASPPSRPRPRRFSAPVQTESEFDAVPALVSDDYRLQIARERALGLHSRQTIADRYGITLLDLEALEQDPVFAEAYSAERASFVSNDPVNGFRQRNRLLAEGALPVMHSMLNDDSVPAKTRVSIFEKFVRYAELDPADKRQVPAGASVVFNFASGLRGVSDRVETVTVMPAGRDNQCG